MARPLTKDESTIIKREFVEYLEKNGTYFYVACKDLGVAPSTVKLWRQKDPEFDKKVADAFELMKDRVENRLQKAMDEGNVTAILGWLNARAKDRGYGNQKEDNRQGVTIQISGSQVEQIEKLANAIEDKRQS